MAIYVKPVSVVLGWALVCLCASSASGGNRADLDGVWQLDEWPTADTVLLTPAAETKQATYDPLKDDPGLRCVPASISRVMLTPSPPIEIKQHAEHVEINYEFMDVRRRVPIAPDLPVEEAPLSVPDYPHVGRAVAHYRGEELVIETTGHRAGVFTTLVFVGLYNSDQMRTTERYIPDPDHLQVVITHVDPVYFAEPMVITYDYHRFHSELLEWGCTIEDASYEKYLE